MINTMMNLEILKRIGLVGLCLSIAACTIPTTIQKTENNVVPESFNASIDTTNSVRIQWRDFFKDPYLTALIDTALRNNQELNIMLQEIQISQNEIRARKGEYLPFVGLMAGAEVEKVGRYTSQGANDANTEIKPGEEFPEPLPNFTVAAYATWELDIWNKLHNAKRSAVLRYLSSIEGRNFMVTHLIAEIANSYFELMALDNQLEIVKQNLAIQQNALEIVRLEKASARVTELAVRRFQAEVLKNQSLQYDIQQSIIEMENKINYLLGRFPQPIPRNSTTFNNLLPDTVFAGIPVQLLENRPDIKQAELELAASKLDISVAKANFYPSLRIFAGVGLESFNPAYLIDPESILYSLGGDLLAPLINRNAIRANYNSANARQVQAVYTYEQRILNAYIEVANMLSMILNLERSYDLKSQQVDALTESINISSVLFRSARADYMEVLLTQRDALESKFELVETKKRQMNAMVNIYQALGGGWN